MEEAMGQLGFFDLPDHPKRLSEVGDPLEEMAQVIEPSNGAMRTMHMTPRLVMNCHVVTQQTEVA
jgi:hypothetical protein